jgi:hypothetical protein
MISTFLYDFYHCMYMKQHWELSIFLYGNHLTLSSVLFGKHS